MALVAHLCAGAAFVATAGTPYAGLAGIFLGIVAGVHIGRTMRKRSEAAETIVLYDIRRRFMN